MSSNSSFSTTNKKIRPDGPEKVTGKLKYMTDITMPNMLYGKILRSTEPHAEILSISTVQAKKLPGVKAVVTYKDVPGLNGFGLIYPDQPVLCKDRVRYIGDAVAAVAADTIEIAEQALQLIKVVYKKLQVVDCPEKALQPDAPHLHPRGNLLHHVPFKKGDVEGCFRACTVIVEETYKVPRQMHAYMETEGGVVVPEKDGTLTVYVGTQHGYKDRFQLARILNMSESDIRVVSSPMGGSFGGKDELNIQPYGALLALATNCPVKIHQSRQESVRAGLKRHPMVITMKTGVDKFGKIIAHKVKIIADTGAYASLGPAVLDFAVEHAMGPYLVPNIEVNGYCVFTNNGVAGEFRGFGGNQVTFAMEGQIDRLAEQLQIDPWEFRRINIRNTEDLGPLGQIIAPTNGANNVLHAIKHSLNQKKKLWEQHETTELWKSTGTGISIAMHGGGLGVGRLDPAGGRLTFTKEGKIEVAFGFEECGQGLLSVIEILVLEEFKCSENDLRIIIGDTALVPPSGSSTASRATSMVWHAMQRMKDSFREKLLTLAGNATNYAADELRLGPGGIWLISHGADCDTQLITFQKLAEVMSADQIITVQTKFDFPTSPDAIEGSHFLYTFSAVLVRVEVDHLTGSVTVLDLDQVIAAGPVVSPIGFIGQIEGGGVMAVGYTLMEDAKMEQGMYLTDNFDTYFIPTICDVPSELNVEAIEELVEGDQFGPRGVGEIGTIAVAPAIARAVFEATGCWVNTLPISREILLKNNKASELIKWI